MPVISSETTSGITVMRMAFTHSVPTSATASTARSSAALPEAAIAAPPASPAPSATRTRVLVFHRRPHIIKSPPLMSSDAPVM